MDDREFFDELFQLFTKTTGAEKAFWMPEQDEKYDYEIHAVYEDNVKLPIAFDIQNEADADFITAIHGCFPDLYRRLVDALDEADRADYDRDSRECRIAELELEVAEKDERISDLEAENDRWQEMMSDLDYRLAELEDEIDFNSMKIGG